jgi:hypothetical protein
VAGIKKGIEDGWEALKEWLMSKVKALIKVGKDAIDSHSPSRATAEEIGLPFMQGIGVGLEAGYGDVAKQAAQHVTDVTAAAQSALDRLSGPDSAIGRLVLAGAGAGAAGGAGEAGAFGGPVEQHFHIELPNVTSLEDPTVVEQIIYKVADRLKRGGR